MRFPHLPRFSDIRAALKAPKDSRHQRPYSDHPAYSRRFSEKTIIPVHYAEELQDE